MRLSIRNSTPVSALHRRCKFIVEAGSWKNRNRRRRAYPSAPKLELANDFDVVRESPAKCGSMAEWRETSPRLEFTQVIDFQ
jgi:hypothetical protein